MRKIPVGIVIIFLWASFGYCQESKQSLQLTIKSDKRVYGVGEEIKLQTTLENNSDKEIIVFWSDKIPVMVPNGRGIFSLLIPASDMEVAEPLYIKPKTSIKKDIVFKIDNFTGTARVMVRYEFKGVLRFIHSPEQEICTGPVISDAITITIEVVKKKGATNESVSGLVSRAKQAAEEFLAKQSFRADYEDKANRVEEFADYANVYFYHSDRSYRKTSPSEGLIRVNKKDWSAQWILQE